jgi:hypothetical protein
MYDVELVRHLCRQIRAESDPDKVQDLVSLLNAVLKKCPGRNHHQIAFLAQKYAFALSD